MGADLSPRETEVITDMAEGLTTTESGIKRFLGKATVKTYRSQIIGKLGARNGAHAVALWVKARACRFCGTKPSET